MRIKQIYHHYHKWEDWRAGMYNNDYEEKEDLIAQARALLSNPQQLEIVMMKVVKEWPYSTEVNLSNKSRNRQAWLGQAACCLKVGTPEDVTKAAWHLLSGEEQSRANAVADRVTAYWEEQYIEKEVGFCQKKL